MIDHPETLLQAVRYFADLEVCNEYMRRIKWPRGRIVCPHCGVGSDRRNQEPPPAAVQGLPQAVQSQGRHDL